jgi:hypothetical protein
MIIYSEQIITTISYSKCTGAGAITINECTKSGLTYFIDESEGETETDQMAPNISNVHAESIGTNRATIDWDTNEPATSQVIWSTQSTYVPGFVEGDVYTPLVLGNRNYVLVSLPTYTKIYFFVKSKDAYENERTSALYSLKTATTTDPGIAPVLE